MVPKGWTKTTFGEHIDLLNGFAFKSALYSDDESDIKLLRGDNIEPNKLRWRNVKRWSKDNYESLEKYHLKVNDFIIAMDRTWITAGLKVAEVKQEDLPCLLVQRVSRIRSLPTLCQDLIKHHFSSYRFEQYVKSVQTETAVPHISSTQINEFNLLLPPLPEQQKIAKILSTWDKAISATERLIDNSTQQKKALMQQLLTGKKRLLNDNGERFEGEWKEATLGKYVTIKSGVSPSKFKLESEGEIPYVKVEDMNNCSKYQIHSRNYADETKSVIFQGAVIFPKRGAAIMNNKVRIAASKLYLDSNMMALIPNKSINSEFLYYLLVKKQLFKIADTSTIPQINNKHITPYAFKLPSLSEQQKIATVLTNADKEIELLEQQLADLQQEKRALMQQLLTGKKRVVV
ncbi:restriction endonuclease subunit S [Psychrobacter sp.]|uniref:restriction endonuclease subunit S n=1 Tax=Psychrobacter sp. TaxID=56811 RepID=UPI003568530E